MSKKESIDSVIQNILKKQKIRVEKVKSHR